MIVDGQVAYKNWSLSTIERQRQCVNTLFHQLATLCNDWSSRVAQPGDDPDTIGIELDTLMKAAHDVADLFPKCARVNNIVSFNKFC